MFSSKCFLPSVSLRMAAEKLIVHERVQSTHPWAEKQGDHWFSGVISLKKRGVIREREN